MPYLTRLVLVAFLLLSYTPRVCVLKVYGYRQLKPFHS